MSRKMLGWLVAAMLIGFCLGGWLGRACNHAEVGMAQNDTVVIKDTVRVTEPIAVDSVPVGVIRVPIVVDRHCGHTDSADVRNEVKIGVVDTMWVDVPRVQKRYEDSLYTAWVSGYEPRLDSISVYRKTIEVTRMETVTKNKRFNVGLTGGFGYGIFSHKPDVWVGVGCTLRLF